jgi:hypothetical protein
MIVEITLPLLGTYHVWLGLFAIAGGMLCMTALLVAIHIDNKRAGI